MALFKRNEIAPGISRRDLKKAMHKDLRGIQDYLDAVLQPGEVIDNF